MRRPRPMPPGKPCSIADDSEDAERLRSASALLFVSAWRRERAEGRNRNNRPMDAGNRTRSIAGRGRSSGSSRKRGTPTTIKLVKEAGKRVEEKCEEIIQRLVDDSLDGHVQCTRLLFDLVERSTEEEEAEMAKPQRNWVKELEGEPEWRGAVSEGDAETGSGGLESES